ncbi:hypothetical protein BJ085DRAFT_31403 [Dimargaris cristalligena]|uniref:Uncharacterized protein n=1 Tax=Dimargaris cristalligena TaxID=215637 RepID=A0A4Q0A1Y0_9FUNG|nr:hypothetical protein BJ085DRAFT_31403 [Dimargaris cristalligena]|eukprot:RKP39170.1 hypothetical protein BJ085DRAFT_31403 [Dimargaris cristalligena]
MDPSNMYGDNMNNDPYRSRSYPSSQLNYPINNQQNYPVNAQQNYPSNAMSYYPNSSMYGQGGMYNNYAGSVAPVSRGLSYPGYGNEYYNNGVMFPSNDYHNRSWNPAHYASRLLGNSYGNYDYNFFNNAYSRVGNQSMISGAYPGNALMSPMHFRGHHTQFYGSTVAPHSRMHNLTAEAVAAAAAFEAMRLYEHRRRSYGFELGHAGSRELIQGAAMAESIRLQQMYGTGYNLDPQMIAQQAAMQSNYLYNDHSRMLPMVGYNSPYY